MTAPATMADIRRLDERINQLFDHGRILVSEADVLSLRDGDVLEVHVDGWIDQATMFALRDDMQKRIGGFVEKRTGAKILVVVTGKNIDLSVVRAEATDVVDPS